MSKTLDELEVGDEVVLFIASNWPYKFGKVEKVTKTQITVNGTRYNRRDGIKIGYGYSSDNRWTIPDRPCIVVLGWCVMTTEDGQRRNSELAIKREKYALIAKIQNARSSDLEQLQIETLNNVVELLGLQEK